MGNLHNLKNNILKVKEAKLLRASLPARETEKLPWGCQCTRAGLIYSLCPLHGRSPKQHSKLERIRQWLTSLLKHLWMKF